MSPEVRRARLSQLEVEHNRLNTEWSELQPQIRAALQPISDKTPEQIEDDQSRLEELFGRAELVHQRQAAIEAELCQLWSED